MTTSPTALAVRHPDRPPNDRARRIVRAALVGLAALGLGIVAHSVSGGALPSLPILLALAALTVLASALAVQARLPPWGVMLLLGVAQQVLHWVLGGLGGASGSLSGSGGHHGEQVPVAATVASQGHSPEVMLMLHAHLGAALLVGWAVVGYRRIARWVPRGRTRPVHERDGASIE